MTVLWYLSGLTCSHANVTEKDEFRRACADHRVIFVAPDTSPRGQDVPDLERYNFGTGAGFHVDATREPCAQHYRMRSYVEQELPAVRAHNFPADMSRQSIMGHSMGGHVIRCRANFDRLRSDLGANIPGVAIIGAGYIGLEAAAVPSERGCRVWVMEVQDRPLARVAGEEIAAFYQQEHEARGVAFHFGVQVEGADKVANGLCALRLSSGARVQCDLAIEGIGIVPAIGPLCEAGAAGENGIIVDDHRRTSLPDVYAIGDCAEHHNRFAGCKILRLESVQNTVDKAAAAVANIWGKPRRIGLCLGSGPTSMISDFRL